MNLVPATTPAPPWCGVKFTCEKCKGEFQLEAADKCTLRLVLSNTLSTYDAPACPTAGCGFVNSVEVELHHLPNEEIGGS